MSKFLIKPSSSKCTFLYVDCHGISKRKQWVPESMQEACKVVKDENMSLHEAARKYSIPVETLRRHTAGLVSLDCCPGPPTVLTSEKETRLAEYCVAMADMGFGLTRDGHGVCYCRQNWSEPPF